jgi:type I restriction enzyme S subunit
MSEWVECKLGTIAEIVGGGTPKTAIKEYWDGNISWLTPRDLTGYKQTYISKGERSISEEGLRNSSARLLPEGVVLLTSRAPIGYLAISKNEVSTNQGFKSIIPMKDKLLNLWIFYWLKNNIDYLQSLGSGTTFAEISGSVVKEIDILLPPLPEQKAIAAVLSSLDDKIDLLHRQNKTLEAMAETLFRQWFIEEAKEDWEEGCLGDIVTNVKDTVSASNINEDWIYIGLEHISRRNIALTQYGYGRDVSSNKFFFKQNDILFGKLRPYFHKVCFSAIEGICSTDILVLRPKKSDFFAFSLFAFYQDDVVEFANLGSGGTRMPRTDWNMLKSFPIALPDKNIIKRFNNLVIPSLEKITKNIIQIQTLEKLRDNLLPKLMSGEVRVSYEQQDAA